MVANATPQNYNPEDEANQYQTPNNKQELLLQLNRSDYQIALRYIVLVSSYLNG